MKGLFATFLLLAGFGSLVLYSANRPVGGGDSVLFTVNRGDGPQTIASALEDAGLVREDWFFLLAAWSRGTRGDFVAGTFELSPSMTTREIERALTTGKPVSDETEVTIVEGWTLNDVANYLEAQGIASKEEFWAEAGKSAEFAVPGELPDWEAGFAFLEGRPERSTLEGYLFPDTYRIFPSAGAKGLVRRMLQNFDRRVTDELRAEASANGRSLHDIVIMASVIEREVRGAEDMAMVSDIFWKRVDAGMGLQADSTVNYITGLSKPSVSYEETEIDHPWNTYKYRGLPAGPIGNPGLQAVIAAVRPEPNDYWYFLTDPAGKVYYGRTLEEHNANRVHLR